jgi:hypothetical protein
MSSRPLVITKPCKGRATSISPSQRAVVAVSSYGRGTAESTPNCQTQQLSSRRRHKMARRSEPTLIDLAAAAEADERSTRSPQGMRRTASELRSRAAEMADCRDRDVMLRLACDFERRAEELARQPKAQQTATHSARDAISRINSARARWIARLKAVTEPEPGSDHQH